MSSLEEHLRERVVNYVNTVSAFGASGKNLADGAITNTRECLPFLGTMQRRTHSAKNRVDKTAK